MLQGMSRRVTLLLTLLALTSCSSRSAGLLRGQVRDWTGGAGRIEVLDNDLKTVVSTTLDASGRFNLPLPTPEQLGPILQESLVPASLPASCQNTVQVSSQSARYYMLGDLTAFPAAGNKLAYTLVSQTVNSDHTKLDKRVMIYASQPVQVRGDLTCGPKVASYRLNLRQGWNYAVSRQSAGNTIIESSGKEGFEGWAVVSR